MQKQVLSIPFICTYIQIQIYSRLQKWWNPSWYNWEVSCHHGEALSREKRRQFGELIDCSPPVLPSCHLATCAPDTNHCAYAWPYVSSMWASLVSSFSSVSTFPSPSLQFHTFHFTHCTSNHTSGKLSLSWGKWNRLGRVRVVILWLSML